MTAYWSQFSEASSVDTSLDPIAFYAMYLIWKEENSLHKNTRLRAADALRIFKCFPKMAQHWLEADDDLDNKIDQEGIDVDQIDDDEECLEVLPTDPEQQWKLAKLNHGVSSPAMDKLV